jgi:hypothetical protein
MSALHVCLADLDCLFMLPLQTERSSPQQPSTPSSSRVLRGCGAGVWVYQVRDHLYTQACVCLEHDIVHAIQHLAIGLQTDCMVIVPAPVVRLPASHV